MNKKIIAVAALGAAAVLGLGAHGAGSLKAEPAQAKALAITAQAMTAKVSDYAPSLRASAVLVGRDEANIGAEIAGVRVERSLVDEGDTVKAGQTLALLDNAQLTLGSAQTHAQLDQSALEVQGQKEALARLDQGLASGSVSLDAVEKARFALKGSQARERAAWAATREAALRLSKTEIKAPFDAVVVERKVRAGSTISQPGEILFVLQPLDSLEAQADFPEKDAAALVQGQSATIFVEGKPFEARVRRPAARVGDGRVASARVAFTHAPQGLRSGMSASVQVSSPPRRAIRIPEAAIAFEGESAYAMRVEQGKAKRAPLKLGAREGGLIEVVEGLSPGDVFVSSGPSFIHEGDLVSPLMQGAK